MKMIDQLRVLRTSFLAFMMAAPLFGVSMASAQLTSPGTARTAPNFSRLDLNHNNIRLSSYRGKVVLLNFWATWCGPCLTEMPIFTAWQREYGSEKFQVIGVSMDDGAPEVIAATRKMKIDYRVFMGDAHLGIAYGGVLGLPVTFLTDRNDKIRARYDGAADPEGLRKDIETLLRMK